jgi:hypothetical protein
MSIRTGQKVTVSKAGTLLRSGYHGLAEISALCTIECAEVVKEFARTSKTNKA